MSTNTLLTPDNNDNIIYTNSTILDLKKRAIKGDAEAACEVGELYFHGDYVDEDISLARRWFLLAERQNEPISVFRLGQIYYHGWHRLPNEDLSDTEEMDESVKGFEFFRRAYKLNVCDTELYIGRCYLLGWGVTQSDKKAYRWFKKSAEAGDIDGIFELGICQYHGTGTKENLKKAERNIRKAAYKDHSEAQYSMAIFYLEGKILEKSEDQTHYWLQKSDANGFEKASEALKDMEEFKRSIIED